MSKARWYPTDLLLAVEQAERALAEQPASALTRLLEQHGLAALAGLFHTEALTEALDELFGGLSQYPWPPLTESDEVYELTPIGSVVLADERAGTTLRGLLFAWAAGNDVVIRTERPEFWQSLVTQLRAFGHPLPQAVTADRQAGPAEPLGVPDLVLADALPEQDQRELLTPAPAAGADALTLRLAPKEAADAATLAARALHTDSRSAWTRGLSRRQLLAGTSLAAARAQDGAAATARIDAKLRYLTARARQAPHYAGLPPIGGRAELATLPVLDKQALESNSLPRGRALYTDRRPSGEVLRSGGSSGAPRYVVYSREDWANMVREAVPLLFSLGLEPGDRLINTLFGGGLYGGLITSACELSRMPVECYTTGQLVTVDDLLMLTGEGFAANAILGQPALILPLLREAKARRPELRVAKVIYGGTPMSEADKRWLRDELGTGIVSSILAANDGAQLGYQCTWMGGSLHHLCEDYNLIEVVGDDGLPVAEGELGHLLVTCMQKFESALIRYQIGDYGRIFDHDCPCGLSGPVLEYAGRADGLVKLMGRRVLHSELLATLEPFQVSQLQVEIVSDGRQETVTLRTESPQQPDPERVRAHLLEHFAVLDDSSAFDPGLGVFALAVECHREGTLPRDPVSGKIKPVLDRRLETER